MDVLAEHDFCPASAMIEIYQEAKKIYDSYSVIYEAISKAKLEKTGLDIPVEDKADKYLKIAGDMAKEISSYAYAKRKAIETSIDPALLEKINEYEKKTPEELLAILKTLPQP